MARRYLLNSVDGTEQTIVEGPLYKEWVEFRAHNIQSFFKERMG
ncbi:MULTISPECIES: hypothetical protein [Oceanobacillus]|nr:MULTISPECIES: hypothetical protein [Oceanobacillus]